MRNQTFLYTSYDGAFRTVTRGHDLYVVQGTVSRLGFILYGWSTHAKNAVKHRIASDGNVVSMRFKFAYQAANQQTFSNWVRMCSQPGSRAREAIQMISENREFTAANALGSKRALASGRSDERAALRGGYPILSRLLVRPRTAIHDDSCSPSRKILQLENVSTKIDSYRERRQTWPRRC